MRIFLSPFAPYLASHSGETLLGRRGLFMLPTRQGWVLALVLLALLLAAINYGNSLVYALCFFLVAIAVVSMLVTDRNLLRLRVGVSAGMPVFAGAPATFRVHLINDTARPRYGLRVIQDRREAAVADVAAEATHSIELRVATVRRGWVAAPVFHLDTRFPLGIMYSWSRRIRSEARALVYPAPAEPWPWRQHVGADHGASAQARGGDDDFSGVREYRPGDSPRRIDWKSAARGRGLLVKEFATGVGATLWFDLERIPAADVESQLQLLCRALIDAETDGLRYGVRLGGRTLAPGGGEAHQQQCLRALALHGLDDK